jgi:hypothetical protein
MQYKAGLSLRSSIIGCLIRILPCFNPQAITPTFGVRGNYSRERKVFENVCFIRNKHDFTLHYLAVTLHGQLSKVMHRLNCLRLINEMSCKRDVVETIVYCDPRWRS